MIKRLKRLPGQLYGKLKYHLQDPVHMSTRMLRAYWHGRELNLVQDNTGAIQPRDVLLFTTLRNEAVRMPFFFDYYRRLGVTHFLLVDNDSTDSLMSLVEDRKDVSVWHTSASYKKSNFGMHWLNFLLRRYGCGHWCLTCDPDEFITFPYCDERDLQDLASFLESEGRMSFCCLMLDMYSDRPLHETLYQSGDDPFSIAPYFDSTGYIQETGWLKENYTRGGVRRRVFFRDIPEQSPALNKTPFVKWRWTYSYFLSMHQLIPSWLNLVHHRPHNSPTGCLMHFKYFSLLETKVQEEMHRGEHWDNSLEYRRYNEQIDSGELSMVYEGSVRYENWRQLIPMGLMNYGQWF